MKGLTSFLASEMCSLTPKKPGLDSKNPQGGCMFFDPRVFSSWSNLQLRPPVFAQGSGPVYVVIANMKLVASPNLHWVQRTGHYEILQLFVGFGNEDFIIWVWSLTQQQWLVPGSLHFGCGLSQGPSHVWWTKIIATRSDDGPTILHTCSGRVVEHQFMM